MTIVSAKPDDLVKKIDHMPKRVATQIIAAAKVKPVFKRILPILLIKSLIF